MFSSPRSFYADYRVSSGSVPLLRDDQDYPPERLVQAIWLHQRVKREQLSTLDGRRLRVLHPGFLSLEGGPDFHGAVIQVGDAAPVSGDVEVDLRPSGWHAHHHDRNPAFGRVRLHVIWDGQAGEIGRGIPTLVLKQFIDAPLGTLGLWLCGDAQQALPAEWRGRCCAPLEKLGEEQLAEMLRQAAEVRLHSKAAEIQARADQCGWEQALWERLLRGLGYKHNSWAMQCLGELKPRWGTAGSRAHVMQARLLGISGLLPAELPRNAPGADAYVRSVWDHWWRERDAFADCLLPAALWRLHGIRPANHPQRRMALAARWAEQNDLPRRLENWCGTDAPSREWVRELHEVMRVGQDAFWSWHWTIRSAPLKSAQPLLGPTRLTDLAINVVLPWLWARVKPADEAGRDRVRQRYFGWPAGEDNKVLKGARERLLGRASPALFKTAALQQGLIQMVRDFCDNSNAVCARCMLPGLVSAVMSREFKPEPAKLNS